MSINGTTIFRNASAPAETHWSLLPSLNLLLVITAIPLNAAVLGLYLTQRQLRSTFSIYLINLTLATVVCLVLYGPLSVLNTLYPRWWLGDHLCTVFLYSTNSPPACVVFAHVLIVANRLWALTKPIHYRHHHSPRNALILSGLTWVIPNIFGTPGVVLDAVYYRTPVASGICMINVDAQRVWAITGELVLAVVPITFMVTSNIFLVCHDRKRRRNRIGRAVSQRSAHFSAHGEELKSSAVVAKEPKRGLVLLVSLTVSLVVCWVPSMAFVITNIFVRAKMPHAGIRGFAGLLFLLQTVIDPLVLMLASREMRNTIKEILRNLCGRC